MSRNKLDFSDPTQQLFLLLVLWSGTAISGQSSVPYLHEIGSSLPAFAGMLLLRPNLSSHRPKLSATNRKKRNCPAAASGRQRNVSADSMRADPKKPR
jgi:hypothetical protein